MSRQGTGQTYSTFPVTSVSDNQQNVFKHEWSILFYYDATGAAPDPVVVNHINSTPTQSIYNNHSTATPSQVNICLGITPAA